MSRRGRDSVIERGSPCATRGFRTALPEHGRRAFLPTETSVWNMMALRPTHPAIRAAGREQAAPFQRVTTHGLLPSAGFESIRGPFVLFWHETTPHQPIPPELGTEPLGFASQLFRAAHRIVDVRIALIVLERRGLRRPFEPLRYAFEVGRRMDEAFIVPQV